MPKPIIVLLLTSLLAGCEATPYIHPQAYRDKTQDYQSSQLVASVNDTVGQHAESLYPLPPESLTEPVSAPDLWPPMLPKAEK